MTTEQLLAYGVGILMILVIIHLIYEAVTKIISEYKRLGFWRFIFKSAIFILALPFIILGWMLSGSSSGSSAGSRHTKVPQINDSKGFYNMNFTHIAGNKYKFTYTDEQGMHRSTNVTPVNLGFSGSGHVTFTWRDI